MKYFRELEQILRNIIYVNLVLGPFYILNMAFIEIFYQVTLRTKYSPDIGPILPILDDDEELVSITLVLPMG